MRWILNKMSLMVFLFTLCILWSKDIFADKLYVLQVDGLSCSFCAYGLEKKLERTEGIKSVKISLNEGKVFVKVADDFEPQKLKEIVEDSGFSLRKIWAEKNEKLNED